MDSSKVREKILGSFNASDAEQIKKDFNTLISRSGKVKKTDDVATKTLATTKANVAGSLVENKPLQSTPKAVAPSAAEVTPSSKGNKAISTESHADVKPISPPPHIKIGRVDRESISGLTTSIKPGQKLKEGELVIVQQEFGLYCCSVVDNVTINRLSDRIRLDVGGETMPVMADKISSFSKQS